MSRKSTFSAASYAAFRPVYPQTLYNAVLAYHLGPKRLCLDLGCGTGIVSRALSPHFDRVIGTDPSPGMIKQAREQSEESNLEFFEGSAESTPFLKEGEVDVVSLVQARENATERFDPLFSMRLPDITIPQSNR
jgi:trans-aconitate 3-methyltransferase